MSKHYPFWNSSGSRGIDDGGKVCDLPFCQLLLKSFRVGLKDFPSLLDDVVKANNFHTKAGKLVKFLVSDRVEYHHALKERHLIFVFKERICLAESLHKDHL